MDAIRQTLESLLPLSNSEWQQISSLFKRESISRKQSLLKTGEMCDFIAFISCGSLCYFYDDDGDEKVTGFFFEGDAACDYASFLSNAVSNHTIEAITDVSYFKLMKVDLEKLYDQDKTFERMGRLISEKLFLSMDRRLNSLLHQSPEERYLSLTKRNPKLIQEVPQYMIASYLGVKPETISRIRARSK